MFFFLIEKRCKNYLNSNSVFIKIEFSSVLKRFKSLLSKCDEAFFIFFFFWNINHLYMVQH